ncbi:MAG: hypothetical protein KDD50_08970 [Bdellovibrionales bacterium]|nr:hypothetical protein [Bdellovibrionales bacterium]
MSEAAIDYEILSQERSGDLQSQFETRLSKRLSEDLSGLRRIILQSVVYGSYDQAKKELTSYIDSKEDYPSFKPRIDRYVAHCQDLISAIESKRNFPALSSLSVSKQQEIFERVIEHFDELKQSLVRIEATGHEVRLNDIRSTTIFIKTAMWSVSLIIFLAFFMEISKSGFLTSFEELAERTSSLIVSSIFDLFGL